LPGIPSANDIKENGINVTEVQSKMLEKIEEQTLYMIELKKENEVLKQEINKLK
jgi:cell division protein FtsB